MNEMMDEKYQAALNACRALAISLLDATRHENPEVLKAIEAQVAEDWDLELVVTLGLGRIALCVTDGATSMQVGVLGAACDVWSPPGH